MKLDNFYPAAIINRMKSKVFYGWYIVTAFVVLNIFVVGLVSKGLTTLVNPLAASFGWSYAQISFAMSMRSLETGVMGPFLGRIVDRYPIKWLIVIGVAIEAVGYLILSQTRNLPMLYISFIVVAFGSSLAAHLAPSAALARWFKKRIGLVSGLVATGIGLGGYGVPLLVFLIDDFGLQAVLWMLAGMVAIVGIPLAFVFRDRPEDSGLLPDGRKEEATKGQQKVQVSDYNPGVKEAIKTRAFWQIGFAEMFHWSSVGAITIHIVPYLTSPSVGMSRAEAGTITMLYLLVGVPSRFIWGWLSDYFQRRYVTAISIVFMAVGLLCFALIKSGSFWMSALFVVIYGIGFGGTTPLRVALVRDYFGIKRFGSMYGLHQAFTTVAGITIPPLVGWIFDTRGTYDPVWMVLTFMAVVGGILMFTMPAPKKGTIGAVASG